MNAKEWAEKLNGRVYLHEVTPDEEEQALNDGIVMVFGQSDDLVEFRGAINDELDCYDGGRVYLTENGILTNECDEPKCPYFEKEKKKCKIIDIVWGSGGGYSWVYGTDIPHETFTIYDEGDSYCRGIAFNIDELKGGK